MEANVLFSTILIGVVNWRGIELNQFFSTTPLKTYDFAPPPINVMCFIDECKKDYSLIERIYNDLSETAHPNNDGIHAGYIKLNREEYYADFGVFWEERFGDQHEVAIRYCIEIFEEELPNLDFLGLVV